MAVYFVSPAGSDSANGLGPDASHATNRPWLTVGKAMHSGSPVVAGDTVYIGPGRYYQQLVPIATISSQATPTSFRGDPWNAQGFRNGSGVRLAPSPARVITGRNATQVDAEGAGNIALTLTTNDPSGLHFFNLSLEAAVSPVVTADTDGSRNLLFEDCRMVTQGTILVNVATGAAWAALGHVYRRCLMIAASANVGEAVLNYNRTVAASSADLDLSILVDSCILVGALGAFFNTGDGTTNAGGARIRNCTVLGLRCVTTASTRASTVTPVLVSGCLGLLVQTPFLAAGVAGQVVDQGYNRTVCASGGYGINVTQHATSKHLIEANIVLPDLMKWGYDPAYVGRNTLGWGLNAVAAQTDSADTSTTPDFFGGQARPWGAGVAVGAIETPSITRDTGSVIDGTDSMKVTGSGQIDFHVAVSAASTTISVKARRSTTAAVPRLEVIAEPDLGVAAQTVTGTAAANTTEALSSAAFTPTASGVVTVRLAVASTDTASSVWFDTLTVS